MSPATFQGVVFPDAGWIPDLDRANHVGEDLLNVAAGSLEQQGLYERYERTYVGHGLKRPAEQSKDRQLTVILTRLALGRAGEEEYQFPKGNIGKLAYDSAAFQIELTHPWPKRTGNPPIPTPDIAAARLLLWRNGYVVWCGLRALSLGGVQAEHIAAEAVTVGALVPRDPSGGQASWVVNVEVAL